MQLVACSMVGAGHGPGLSRHLNSTRRYVSTVARKQDFVSVSEMRTERMSPWILPTHLPNRFE